MKVKEAKQALQTAWTVAEDRRMIVDCNQDLQMLAIMQIKIGNMTPEQAATWLMEKYSIKNFRC